MPSKPPLNPIQKFATQDEARFNTEKPSAGFSELKRVGSRTSESSRASGKRDRKSAVISLAEIADIQ